MSQADTDDIFSGQIRVLQSMGFPDVALNRRALQRAEGRINEAIEHILAGSVPDEPQGPTPHQGTHGGHLNNDNTALLAIFDPLHATAGSRPEAATPAATTSDNHTRTYKFPALSPTQQHALFQLHQMGFRSPGKTRHALHLADWDVSRAVEVFLERESTLDEAFSALNEPGSGGGNAFTAGSTSTGMGGAPMRYNPTTTSTTTTSVTNKVATPLSGLHAAAPQNLMHDPFADPFVTSHSSLPSTGMNHSTLGQPHLSTNIPPPAYRAIPPPPTSPPPPVPSDPFADEYRI
ncbi:hypothetical protein BC832DRAFT_544313 [Gaertneriomyces semiglobifer]|nr:hypothetical protein BC832DRAFT_544313 [Gaertneriomyces semiglobifer]